MVARSALVYTSVRLPVRPDNAPKSTRCTPGTATSSSSAVANHAHAAAHNIHWVPRVLTKEKNATTRNFKEALAIKAATKQKGPEVTMNQDNAMNIRKLWLNLV